MARTYKLNGLTISKGNVKLEDSIAIFNLPAIKSCPNCSMCAKTCYAKKAEKRYPTVKACREANLQASMTGGFVADMVKLIVKSKAKVVRIHEAGDFYSQEYADKWSEIARLLPEIKFYAYSKSPFRPTGANLNVVESILPNGELNYGKEAEILPLAQKYDAFICPCKPQMRAKLCGSSCTVCQSAKHVLFVIH